MRVVFPVMLIVLSVVLVGFLITNPSERVSIMIGTTEYPDVPLSVVALVALAMGVALTAVVALIEGATIRLANRRLRREIQRLETENSFLRSQPRPADRPAGGTDEFGYGAEPPGERDESVAERPASAPVYDPGAVDPATRGD